MAAARRRRLRHSVIPSHGPHARPKCPSRKFPDGGARSTGRRGLAVSGLHQFPDKQRSRSEEARYGPERFRRVRREDVRRARHRTVQPAFFFDNAGIPTRVQGTTRHGERTCREHRRRSGKEFLRRGSRDATSCGCLREEMDRHRGGDRLAEYSYQHCAREKHGAKSSERGGEHEGSRGTRRVTKRCRAYGERQS